MCKVSGLFCGGGQRVQRVCVSVCVCGENQRKNTLLEGLILISPLPLSLPSTSPPFLSATRLFLFFCLPPLFPPPSLSLPSPTHPSLSLALTPPLPHPPACLNPLRGEGTPPFPPPSACSLHTNTAALRLQRQAVKSCAFDPSPLTHSLPPSSAESSNGLLTPFFVQRTVSTSFNVLRSRDKSLVLLPLAPKTLTPPPRIQ